MSAQLVSDVSQRPAGSWFQYPDTVGNIRRFWAQDLAHAQQRARYLGRHVDTVSAVLD